MTAAKPGWTTMLAIALGVGACTAPAGEPVAERQPPPVPERQPDPPPPKPPERQDPERDRQPPPKPDDGRSFACFVGPTRTPMEDSPFGMRSADLNGDGILDLVGVGDELVDGVFLRHIEAWLGSRDGRFRQSARVDYDGEGLQPAIADLTEDGHPDLLLGDMSLASFSIWRGDGQGGFERHATFPAGIKAREPHLGDLDGDGDLDLVLPRHRVVEIHGNRGQGQFSKLTTLEVAAGKGMATPENLSLGDVDNDGDLDLVIPLSDDQALEIWLNRGSGRFDRHVRHERPMLSPSHSALGDFDGDGNLDLVLGGAEARLLIARGDGHGDFDLQRAQRLAIDGDDHVAGLETGGQERADLVDVGDHQPMRRAETEAVGNGGIDRLAVHAGPGALKPLVAGLGLIDEAGDQRRGDGETDAVRAAGAGEDAGVDADEAAVHIHESAA